VVDLHAITTPYDPKKMPAQIIGLAADYLAAGLDPDKCVLFVQSHVKEHAELAWLLGTITPMGELKANDAIQGQGKTASRICQRRAV